MKYAAEWSDFAAIAVHASLHAQAADSGDKFEEFTLGLLQEHGALDTFVAGLHRTLGSVDRKIAADILETHQQRVRQCADKVASMKKIRAMLKPLRERSARTLPVEDLIVPTVEPSPLTFHGWLAVNPRSERLRDVADNLRVLKGVQTWPMGWITEPVVFCFERANARVHSERGGHADERFMRGVVNTIMLPTALGNASTHLLVLAPGKRLRFLTVEETARAFQVPAESPLMRVLSDPKLLKPIQAVSCLGRSIHVGVARCIIRMLVSRGVLRPGLTYGSAFSGIDTFAAAVEAEFGRDWTYLFASELNDRVRLALLSAWADRGLLGDCCYTDARSEDAVSGPSLDLWVSSPPCESHSKRNMRRNEGDQRLSWADVWSSLEYVVRRRPKVVVMENVTDPSAVSPMTGLLTRLPGYAVESGRLDPPSVAGAPMARDRHFWVLIRLD